MIQPKTFDKVFFIYQYLRDSLIQPAWVGKTDFSFVRAYIAAFKVPFSEDFLGHIQCADLDKTLSTMCGRLLLERRKIRLNPWMPGGAKAFEWQYALTSYAPNIISSYQDYFLNLLVRKHKKRIGEIDV